MNFKDLIRIGDIQEIEIDKIRAKSLIKTSEKAIISAKLIPINANTQESIFRELYEGLRACCEAIGYLRGYKFRSHEGIPLFLKEILHQDSIADKFDRYRKIRNGINYYGETISSGSLKEALTEIPLMISILSKFVG